MTSKNVAIKVVENGLKEEKTLKGKTVKMYKVGDLTIPPIEGEVIAAFEDVNGIVQYVQIIKADGSISWVEAFNLFIITIGKVKKWFPRIRAWWKRTFN